MESNFLFRAIVIVIAVVVSSQCEIIVQTVHGPIRGTTRRALESDRPVYSYFGVKFGRSTDYQFRFRPPVDPWRWTKVEDCTNENVPFCQQDRNHLNFFRNNTYFKYLIDDDQPLSEDCLTVNVFSPVHPDNINQHLPVVVWIYGGGLKVSSTTNKMWMLPAFENVVLVTINYRVSVFGFLTTEDKWAEGNAAFYDQVKGLEWVRDNVEQFGGNPDKVTIIGESAGGFCVSAHLVSPLSRGLFHKAVALSGAAEMPVNFVVDQKEKAQKLFTALDCKFEDNVVSLTCTRNRNVTSSQLIQTANKLKLTFDSNVDGSFLPDSPFRLLEDGKFDAEIPVLIGVISGEFDYTLGRRFISGFKNEILLNAEGAKRLIFEQLEMFHPEIAKDKNRLDEFYDVYVGDSPIGGFMKGVVDFFADLFFNSKSIKMAKKLKERGSDVYFMELDSRPTFYETSELFTRPYNFGRADHTDDILFLFGFPFLDTLKKSGIEFTKKEKDLTRKMMKSLANFADTGNLNTAMTSAPWEKFPSFLSIKDFDFKIEKDFQQRRMKIWENVPPVFQHISHSVETEF